MDEFSYHHGLVIEEFREKCKMTQAKLAELWPKPDGGEGVNTRYVQDIEYGKKHIEDSNTLRKLCDILHIPHWRVGLSEYDPFNPNSAPRQGHSMYNETLNTAESLIKRTWHLRRVAPLPFVEESVESLNRLFTYLRENIPPPLQLENHFMILYAQVQRLNAVIDVEHQRYESAFRTFESMHDIAVTIDHPATLALSLLGMGTELERAGKQQETVDRLEEARDESFRASKHVAALSNAYLARAYASNEQPAQFKRAIDTAQKIARDIKMYYGDGTDFVFHSISGILAERSYGYLEIKEPEKTLEMKDEIKRQIAVEGNVWLDAWIPLDWARAYMMLNDFEKSAEAALLFFHRASALQSPHAKSRAYRHLKALEGAGYGDMQAVKDFRNELQENDKQKLV